MKRLTTTAGLGHVLGLTGLFGLSFAPLGAAQQDTSGTAAQLLAASEVIARYVEAIGGRAAILERKFSHVTGTSTVPWQGMSGPYEVFAAAPNKILYKVEIPVMGEMMGGFDGQVGWNINPITGPMLLKGQALAQARHQADFYSELHDERNFTSMETVARTMFEGRECYKLQLVTTSGDKYVEFFDTETGLLAGRTSTQEWPAGPMSVTTVFTDYQQFGTVLFPTKAVQKMQMGLERIDTIASVEDVAFDQSVFDLPQEIRVLLPDSSN